MGKRPGQSSEAAMSSSEGSTRTARPFELSPVRRHRRSRVPSRSAAAAAALVALAIASLPFAFGGPAFAAIVPTVPLATSANNAVLAGSTVTNTGNSTLDGSLGLWPGTSVVGFPPGLVLPPGTTDITNAAAQQAQSDLTTAYVNAAGRPIDATTTADLANLHLSAGVYSGPSKSALQLTGPLVLDGGGDMSSVFIFQTDSSLTTGSASTVSLINGAQECNVFWVVGSSATLGTGSVFTGNILALSSITVTNSVTVHGRALARNGAVTLDNDTFTKPTCAQPTGTTPTTAPGGTGTTVAGGTGGTGPGGTDTSLASDVTLPSNTDVLFVVTLPRTGQPVQSTVWFAFVALGLGVVAIRLARRRTSVPG